MPISVPLRGIFLLAITASLLGNAALAPPAFAQSVPRSAAPTSSAEGGPDAKFNFDETRVAPYVLPNLFRAQDGDSAPTPDQWKARREVILNHFREQVYGRSPGRPAKLGFQTLKTDPQAMGGAATMKQIAIVSRHAGRSHRFVLTLMLPNAVTKPVPVFLLLNHRSDDHIDPTREKRSPFWPAEEMIARGFGVAAFQTWTVAPDHRDRYRKGAIELFEGTTEGPRPANAWGAVAAWSWGASRALDYLQTDKRVDGRKVAVVGHSRGGKAALWAAAEDQRFAMAISNNSGEGGASLARRNFGETIEKVNEGFPHWFAENYKAYAGREEALPVDQHMLMSLIAPRPLYVTSAENDLWSDPKGEFLSLAHASPVYGLWQQPAMKPEAMPELDEPVIVGTRGYHIRSGSHGLTTYDWERFADFADRVWSR